MEMFGYFFSVLKVKKESRVRDLLNRNAMRPREASREWETNSWNNVCWNRFLPLQHTLYEYRIN